MNTKQVIILRKFKNLRTGKYCSQACHSSMAFLTKGMYCASHNDGFEFATSNFNTEQTREINHWLKNSFRKIVCYVESEEELRELHQKAFDKGLITHLIEDNGATEFGGIKTLTALAIGPAEESKFVGLTDHLPLL
jgi:PTH2 family peptidyl-tRNA hydrolase